jgi:putative effector of murein hydrolase
MKSDGSGNLSGAAKIRLFKTAAIVAAAVGADRMEAPKWVPLVEITIAVIAATGKASHAVGCPEKFQMTPRWGHWSTISRNTR